MVQILCLLVHANAPLSIFASNHSYTNNHWAAGLNFAMLPFMQPTALGKTTHRTCKASYDDQVQIGPNPNGKTHQTFREQKKVAVPHFISPKQTLPRFRSGVYRLQSSMTPDLPTHSTLSYYDYHMGKSSSRRQFSPLATCHQRHVVSFSFLLPIP